VALRQCGTATLALSKKNNTMSPRPLNQLRRHDIIGSSDARGTGSVTLSQCHRYLCLSAGVRQRAEGMILPVKNN